MKNGEPRFRTAKQMRFSDKQSEAGDKMNYYLLILVALLLIALSLRQAKKRRIATIINHRRNHKNRENTKMKELAQNFVGKECLVYTITSDNSIVKGVIKEVTDCGLLIDDNGNMQAVNLEYVTRIREYPRKKNGKKKVVFD